MAVARVRTSPHERHEPTPDSLLVFSISGQVPGEEACPGTPREMKKNPIATSTSPATTAATGTWDHPKRWSSAGTTRRATNPLEVKSTQACR
jgi:hypothetical protein